MQLVKDGRTLKALERAGKIKEPEPMFRPKGKTWGKGYAYVNNTDYSKNSFSHNKKNYKLTYVSGCFFPFVEKIN